MTSGFRVCSIRCSVDDQVAVMLVLNRYAFVDSVRTVAGGVEYVMDLAALPAGDGPAAELMVKRDVDRAVALHRSTP